MWQYAIATDLWVVDFDRCMVGMKNRHGQPIKKMWRISGKNPNMRYLSRTQRVDIAGFSQFYDEKLFTFVDCPTEYQAANMMPKANSDSREWLRDMQTTGTSPRAHRRDYPRHCCSARGKGGIPEF